MHVWVTVAAASTPMPGWDVGGSFRSHSPGCRAVDSQGEPVRWAPVEGRQAICRSDDHTGAVLGIFAPGYAMHQYDEWLLTTVANLLDDDLAIGSAGLPREGAIAWVEVSVPDTITTPEGVDFRPNLLATTSFDGSIATTFKRTITATVCDNTRELALSEKGQQYKANTQAGPMLSWHQHERL